jgi:hypothetical protein
MMDFFIQNTELHFQEKFPSDKASSLIQEFRIIFMEIYEKNQYLMPDDLAKRHGMNPAFVMALEKTLRDIVLDFDDLKKSVLQIYKYIMRSFLEMQHSRYKNSDDRWELFLSETKAGNAQLYDNNYFELNVIQEDKQSFAFDLEKCFYFEIFKDNGKEELGSILCEYDYFLADNINEWITFNRTETIATGYNRCNFSYQPKSTF